MLYLYNGILFDHKKERSTDTYYSMDELWKHYAKWKKPDTEVSFIWNHQNRQLSRKSIQNNDSEDDPGPQKKNGGKDQEDVSSV